MTAHGRTPHTHQANTGGRDTGYINTRRKRGTRSENQPTIQKNNRAFQGWRVPGARPRNNNYKGRAYQK